MTSENSPGVAAAVFSTERNRAAGRSYFLLTLLLTVAALLNIWMGETMTAQVVTPVRVLQTLGTHLPLVSHFVSPLPEDLHDRLDSIVWEQRVPRTLGAILIGMLLAMAGVAFQSFLMNPLADPYMVGVSSGAALGSVLVILLGGTGLLAGFAQPLAAFGTGLAATGLVYLLARQRGRVSAQTFLLAGVVVGTFLWSLIPLTLSLANRSGRLDRQSAILSQLLGNLDGLGWAKVAILCVFSAVGLSILWASRWELNAMALGEESAAGIGVDTERFKRRIIVAGALVTAAAVSVAGIIAFVGLVVPHIARRLAPPDHRYLLPAAMLTGGLVLVLADLLSRVLFANLEIGVITSLFGAPVFCWLLRKRAAGK